MTAEHLRRLPFDHFARYQLAAEVVDATRRVGASRVLDIGGGPGSLAAFCPDDRVISSDLHLPSHWHAAAPDLVLADGAKLPFADSTFDIVVTLDTLEHVPPERRPDLLSEALRVSRGYVLVVCPCGTPGVPEADAALLSFVRQRFGEEFETVGVLQEHLGYGHPDPQQVLRDMRRAGADVESFPSGRLDRWLPMMLLFYNLMALGKDDPVERVQAWYNALFYRDDLRAPSYRQAFLARVAGADGPAPEEIVGRLLPQGPPLAADTSALEALRIGLTEELVGTVDHYRAQLADLERRLAEATVESDRQRTRAELAEAHAAGLEAFRQQVLNHPLVKATRPLRRTVRALGRR
ncbi:MAG TPA: methyltransferase domain-containing protein [Egibacteraceae bacterium]|nr:methyltransferase domain-containing protein [Egibacteraceae bacterium]